MPNFIKKTVIKRVSMELENTAADDTGFAVSAADSPMADTVIDPDLTTDDMESDVDASVGGEGGGNNKKAPVAVGALYCMSCGIGMAAFWRRDDVGNILCNICGEYILLSNFRLSFSLVSFLLLSFRCGAGRLVFISRGVLADLCRSFHSPGID